MKKFIHISGLAVLLLLAGCKNEDPGFPSSSGTDEEVGYIVTSGLSVSVADNEIISTTTGESSPTKSATATRSMAVGIGSQVTADSATTKASPSTTEASDDYKVTILNTKTSETMNYTYADLKKEENQKFLWHQGPTPFQRNHPIMPATWPVRTTRIGICRFMPDRSPKM